MTVVFNILSTIPKELKPVVNLNARNTFEYTTRHAKTRGLDGDVAIGPKRRVQSVSCVKIIEGDKYEIKKSRRIMDKSRPTRIPDSEFVNLTVDCDAFRAERNYDALPVSSEEKSFPLAYNILMYRDIDQTERLLRAIYRHHNVYCIHIDASASESVKKGMAAIVACLKNVFLVSKAEDIIYEGFSRLKADLNCMEDLVKHNVKWQYLINLPSQQFPLKTNSEVVKILQIYNGANDVEGITVPGRMFSVRYKYIHKLSADKKKLVNTSVKKTPPPHNITVVKGSAYGVFSRAFVDFVLTDPRARDLLEWSKDIRSPDEYYWATLHHSKVLGAPGSYIGQYQIPPYNALAEGYRITSIAILLFKHILFP